MGIRSHGGHMADNSAMDYACTRCGQLHLPWEIQFRKWVEPGLAEGTCRACGYTELRQVPRASTNPKPVRSRRQEMPKIVPHVCAYCQSQVAIRDGEGIPHYNKRKYCSEGCERAHKRERYVST
jgi:hypothetical protein